MYLILGKMAGRHYAYFEDEAQFGHNEKERIIDGRRICPGRLDEECDLNTVEDGDWYMVIPVAGNVPRRAEVPKKKKKARA